jgi:hypothetical protein
MRQFQLKQGESPAVRAKFSRQRLDRHVRELVLAHVQAKTGDPAPPQYEHTHLWQAMTYTLKTSPQLYVKSVFQLLPRDVVLENTTSDWDDEQVDAMIEMLRARLIEQRQAALPAPVIIDGKANGLCREPNT